jgi:hypothetical protein
MPRAGGAAFMDDNRTDTLIRRNRVLLAFGGNGACGRL